MTRESAKSLETKLLDTDNFEGFMPSNSEQFALLVNNKGTRSFASKDRSKKPNEIDGIIAKIYLAL